MAETFTFEDLAKQPGWQPYATARLIEEMSEAIGKLSASTQWANEQLQAAIAKFEDGRIEFEASLSDDERRAYAQEKVSRPELGWIDIAVMFDKARKGK